MNNTPNIRYVLLAPQSEKFRPLQELIANDLKRSGIEPLVLEEALTPGTTIPGAMQQAIERSDFIIADLTGNSPNVMYEVGFAQALRKPVLPIVQEGVGHVLPEFGSSLYLVYDPSKPNELLRNIHAWVSRYFSEEKRRTEIA